jgi:predicted ATPase
MEAVLEAGPHCGKSSLLGQFAALGLPVVNEIATEVISSGGPLPWDDHVAFQLEVLRKQLAAERSLKRLGGWKVLDRGSPCGIAYRRIFGREVPDFFRRVRPAYAICFLLAPVPGWTEDGLRYERDTDFSRAINPEFRRLYEEYGIPVVDVPFASLLDRLNFCLEKMGLAPVQELPKAFSIG